MAEDRSVPSRVPDEEKVPALRECPATLALGTLWVVAYLAMAWHQGTLPLVSGGQFSGNIATSTTHLFGDQTPAAISQGEVWRALTSTFTHFSLLHLATNLIGFVLFGRMVEGWYGSGPFVAIYAAIGMLGNLLSAFIKLHNGAEPLRPSGGGSGVAVGLIALIAVAGWRSGSRFGRFVQGMMCILLMMLGLMGSFFPLHDNLGHASGALFGALIGLLHPWLLRSGRRFRVAAGIAGVAALLTCFGLQWASARAESRVAKAKAILPRLVFARFELLRARLTFAELSRRGSSPEPPAPRYPTRPNHPTTSECYAILHETLRNLQALRVVPGSGREAQALRRMNSMAERPRKRPPTPGEAHRFATAAEAVSAGVERLIRETQSRIPPEELARKPPTR